jgi:RNA methyltransferase, TrmH family
MLPRSELKAVQALHKRKGRDESGLFLAEGPHLLEEIIRERPDMISVIYTTDRLDRDLHKQASRGRFKLAEVSEDELSRLSVQQSPNAVVAVCKQMALDVVDDHSAPVLFLDDIRDPGNFGTIIRLCDWFGMSTLYCSPHSCELYNPKVIQSSMGSFLRVKVVYVEGRSLVRGAKVPVYGAVLNGMDLYQSALEPGIVIIGNESRGVSLEMEKLVDHPLTIPSAPGRRAESLNAAMAASIICSEFYRRKHEG